MRRRPHRLTLALVALALAGAACNRRPADPRLRPPVAAGPLQAKSITFELAVYYLPAPASDPRPRLDALLSRDTPELRPVARLPATEKGRFVSARLERDVQRSYRPPDAAGLRHCGHGLTAEQAADLPASREALVMDFRITGEPPWKGLRSACAVAGRLARETDGLVWDNETRQAFSPDAWDRERVTSWTEEIPKVADHTVIHLYRMNQRGDSTRAVTLGMVKLGLPDVAVEGFATSRSRSVGNLVNSLDQALAEGTPVGRKGEITLRLRDLRNTAARKAQIDTLKAGAKGEALLRLREGLKEPGDPDNRLIAVSFERYPGPDLSARADRLFSSLFGSEESIVTGDHDEELLAARRAARGRLPALHRALAAGLAPGEYILIKAPFAAPDGGDEWMWVEIAAWSHGAITGTLRNDPVVVKDLQAGQTVTVDEDKVFDYIRHRPDGTEEGNATGAILDKQEARRRAGDGIHN